MNDRLNTAITLTLTLRDLWTLSEMLDSEVETCEMDGDDDEAKYFEALRDTLNAHIKQVRP